MSSLISLLVALPIWLSWFFAPSPLAALFGWIAVLIIVTVIVRARFANYRVFYFAGLLTYLLGFDWLWGTISRFGGFPFAATLGLFCLFLTISALQFVVFVFFVRKLPPLFSRFGILTAAAWTVSEQISIRIFPWELGHSQLAFTPFAQISDLAGTPLIGFLMLWVVESWCRFFMKERESKATAYWAIMGSSFAMMAAMIYGLVMVQNFKAPQGSSIDVMLVQASLDIKEKGGMTIPYPKPKAYVDLTRLNAKESPLLVVWPESAMTDWVYENIGNTLNDRRIPSFGNNVVLLSGANTYSSSRALHNSALVVQADGSVPKPYHKRILMPFGEFMPFAETFPWLKDINPNMGEFQAGKKASVFDLTVGTDDDKNLVRVSPLICYEDLVPQMARESVQQGSELLVNLTNDVWFGDGLAAEHHNTIASFRAIENRRFLLRATNTGVTAVINPLGQVTGKLDTFKEGTLLATVQSLSYNTLYTEHLGDSPWRVLSILVVVLSLAGIRRAGRGAAATTFRGDKLTAGGNTGATIIGIIVGF